MDNFYQINNDFPKYGLSPMSADTDLISELMIIDYFKPKTIWELGTGTGDWAIFMNYYSSLKDPIFNLTETLEWGTNPIYDVYLKNREFWPSNIEELDSYIKNTSHKLGKPFNYNLYNADLYYIKDKVTEPIDLIRIDANMHYQYEMIDFILENSADNLLILVDDIETNRCLDRFMLMQEQVYKNKLELIWVGKSSGAWCRPGTINCDDLYKKFIENTRYFKSHLLRDGLVIFNKDVFYITSE